MMLQNSFFYFTGLATSGDLLKTNITLNAGHEIFNGHFPGQPVVPGACMMQMVKEVVESYTSKAIQLVKADNIKFLAFIDPTQNGSISLELKITEADQRLKIDAQLLEGTVILFKFKGSFKFKTGV